MLTKKTAVLLLSTLYQLSIIAMEPKTKKRSWFRSGLQALKTVSAYQKDFGPETNSVTHLIASTLITTASLEEHAKDAKIQIETKIKSISRPSQINVTNIFVVLQKAEDINVVMPHIKAALDHPNPDIIVKHKIKPNLLKEITEGPPFIAYLTIFQIPYNLKKKSQEPAPISNFKTPEVHAPLATYSKKKQAPTQEDKKVLKKKLKMKKLKGKL